MRLGEERIDNEVQKSSVSEQNIGLLGVKLVTQIAWYQRRWRERERVTQEGTTHALIVNIQPLNSMSLVGKGGDCQAEYHWPN